LVERERKAAETQKQQEAAAAAQAAAKVAQEEALAAMKAKMAADLASIQVGEDEDDADEPAGAISLAMPIEDWLGMYDASNCVEHFKAEDIDTLEDLAFIVQTEDDLTELGVSTEQITRLWPSVLAAQNGDLSTLDRVDAAGAVGTVGAVEAEADADVVVSDGGMTAAPASEADEEELDPFAALEAELASGVPSSLF